MERKSIGAFIAVLRKANGMTQKDLAEKLNVSDKTISRWERDDGAPDLSLIPVIAEIFDVTCDELLRGERKGSDGQEENVREQPISPKSEKQRQRILAVSLSRYKMRSCIAIGLAIVGLIGAMAGNFAFLRAYIGFLVAAVFYLAAVICQVIFVNSAFLSVADEEQAGIEVDRFKCSVVRLAEGSVGLTAVLFGFSLPLVLLAWDAYVGLSAESWFASGAICALIALVVCGVVCYFLNASLLQKGVYPLSGKEEAVWRHNRKWMRRCAVGLVSALAVTGVAHGIAQNVWTPTKLSDAIVFDNVDAFVEFMEQEVPRSYYYGGTSSIEQVAPAPELQLGETIYYDEFGNVISEEEALRDELVDRNGNTVCEYVRRNKNVASIRHGAGEGEVTWIEVVTYDALQVGRVRHGVLNTVFTAAYVVEALAVILVYVRKRTK